MKLYRQWIKVLSALRMVGTVSLLWLGLLWLGYACSPASRTPPIADPAVSSSLLMSPSVSSKSSMSVPPVPSTSLEVNPDRLWHSLEAILALNDRFSEAGRAQTRSFLIDQLTDLGWEVETQGFTAGKSLSASNVAANLTTNLAGENLIARKTWGSSDRLAKRWIVAAHYDTVQNTPGADDNGTGVAALLELAHLFAAVSLTPPEPVSLELIFFDLEEQGLLGSFAYTQRPENLERVQGAIVLEMLGYTCSTPGCQQYPKNLLIEPPSDRGDFLAIVGDAEHPEMLVAFTPEIQTLFVPSDLKVFTLSVPLKGALTPDVLRSDHAPFWLQNIGAVMVTDTANLRNPHYHQATDTLETIDRSFLIQVSQVVVNAIQYYLGRPE